MTPAARVAAAIDILDRCLTGEPAEKALTNWARRSRFAGSKDRAAIRDHVFDVLRLQETAQAAGQGSDGRALMIGLLRHKGIDPRTVFTGERFAPPALADREHSLPETGSAAFHWNMPAWLAETFQRDLGTEARKAAAALTGRAPITLRVNAQKATRADAIRMLAEEGITARPNALARLALTVTDGARRLRQSTVYLSGYVELQDASSQAVIADLPPGKRCLDYCAGGGGKALALAAQPDRDVVAHDIDPERMKDIEPRARRAGVVIRVETGAGVKRHAPFDLVLCDAPCSGSGAWRRTPQAKWRFTPDRLAHLCAIQQEILAQASALVSGGGTLVYATCSVLRAENETAVARFIEAHADWTCCLEQRFDIGPEGDGFFVAHFRRAEAPTS